MSSIIRFGEHVKGYEVPVLNEREVRAAAGIMFTGAMVSFMNAFLIREYDLLKVFITAFLIDFAIRLFINPLYAPSMVLGRIAVQKQKAEYTGAPQKKFAWSIGLIMAVTMFILVVILENVGIFNLIMCIMCLTFLLFESAFGICIGCYLYSWLYKKPAKLCPGGACEIIRKEKIQQINSVQIIMTLGIIISLLVLFNYLKSV